MIKKMKKEKDKYLSVQQEEEEVKVEKDFESLI